MKHDRIISDDFKWRTVECRGCKGSGTVGDFVPYAGEYIAGEPIEVECPDCDGSGEQDASCAECSEDHKLNEDGVCVNCALSLATVEGDPFKGMMK